MYQNGNCSRSCRSSCGSYPEIFQNHHLDPLLLHILDTHRLIFLIFISKGDITPHAGVSKEEKFRQERVSGFYYFRSPLVQNWLSRPTKPDLIHPSTFRMLFKVIRPCWTTRLLLRRLLNYGKNMKMLLHLRHCLLKT